MNRERLREALNDCLDRLAAGETVEQCLARYPELAPQLRPLLDLQQRIRTAQGDEMEAIVARDRGRPRFEEALSTPARRGSVASRVLAMVATLLLVFAGVGTVVLVSAQDSLPGDPLYGVKRAGENVWLALSGDDALLDQLTRRRHDELARMLAQNRTGETTFEGAITSISRPQAVIAGFDVRITPATRGTIYLREGGVVAARVRVTADGDVVALELTRPQSALPTAPDAIVDRVTPTFAVLDCSQMTFAGEIDEPYCIEPDVAAVSAVYQPFENGAMLWDGTSVTVLNTVSGTYTQLDAAGRTAAELNETPPGGLFAPADVFVALWQGDVRSRVGWATAAGTMYTARLQRGQSEIRPNARLQLYSLPDGRLLALETAPDDGVQLWRFIDFSADP